MVAAVVAEADGSATDEERAALDADHITWTSILRRLLLETDEALTGATGLDEGVRAQVVADLVAERTTLGAALGRITGEDIAPPPGQEAPGAHEAAAVVAAAPSPEPPADDVPGVAALQASWADGRVVIWVGGWGVTPGATDDVRRMLADADAAAIEWEHHAPVPMPSGETAEAVSAPLAQTLGWLVGVGAEQVGGEIASSLRWLGGLAVWGAELVAAGRMVPVLRSSGQSSGGRHGAGRHRVRWMPALVARDRLHATVGAMPNAVTALQPTPQPEGVARSVLTSVVDAVCRAGADRLVAPATVALARNRIEVSEAVLSGLDGHAFQAEAEVANRVAEDLKRWAAPVTTPSRTNLTVRLDPPAADGSWMLRVEAVGVDKGPLPVEHALVVASGNKSQQVEGQLRRLERLLPVLRRPSTRRGQVLLDIDEASDLMFTTGPVVAAAGFEVYLPLVSRRRPSPQLRLFAEALAGRSQVGVSELANVRWSVFFDDMELDAAEISRLAAEARPLVQIRGRWVHLDRADLAAAAAALAERASITRMSGADLIRHAVGLEGSSLGGPLRVEGNGWAVDLLRGATSNPPAPVDAPDGFVGQLRHYQAEAAGWLGFLDRAGLGGCLALDMGLGKTPTVLAHLVAHAGDGPALVVCPPAVVTNWASEAARFAPGLRVSVHHGPRRVGLDDLPGLADRSDIVLTTYATAVRDMDALAEIEWRRVVVDEAQAIKNHQNETAGALRRLSATSRLALTGTPVENGLGDLWAILDFTNPGLVGGRTAFIDRLSQRRDAEAGDRRSSEESALRALNGLLVFRRTKSEPDIAAELPDKVDKLDQCAMSAEQIGLYQAVVNRLVDSGVEADANERKGRVLAAITALKQICDHPAAYMHDDDQPLAGRSGKLTRLEEIVDEVFSAGERILVFTHFARWGSAWPSI